MKTAVMQPYLFPYIGYLQLIAAVDKFVFFDDVNFIKKGWINRNRILCNGEEHLFALPLEKISQNKKINQTHIFEAEKSKPQLFNLIQSSYKTAPYAREWLPQIQEWLLSSSETRISHYNGFILTRLARALDLKTSFEYSSDIPGHTDLHAQSKILAIISALGATQYYNLSGGVDLYKSEDFSSQGIELKFIRTPKFIYDQPSKTGFLPNLSILDLLFYVPLTKIQDWIESVEVI